MNFFIEYIGYFAGVCTTIAFIPQVTKVWLSKNVEGLSISMFIIFTVGLFCWLIYGILQKDLPLIIANLITLILALLVLLGIIKFKKNV